VTTRLRGAFVDLAGDARTYADSRAALRLAAQMRKRTAVTAGAIAVLLAVPTLGFVLPDLGGRSRSGDPPACGSASPGGDPSSYWPDPGDSASPGNTPDPYPDGSTSPGATPDPYPDASTSPGDPPNANPGGLTSPGYTPDPYPDASTSPGSTPDPYGSTNPGYTPDPYPGVSAYPSQDGGMLPTPDATTWPSQPCQPATLSPPAHPVELPDGPVGEAAFVYEPCSPNACAAFVVLTKGEQFLLPGSPASIEWYTLSPDGRLLGLPTADGYEMRDLVEGTVQTVHIGDHRPRDWSADGRWLLLTAEDSSPAVLDMRDRSIHAFTLHDERAEAVLGSGDVVVVPAAPIDRSSNIRVIDPLSGRQRLRLSLSYAAQNLLRPGVEVKLFVAPDDRRAILVERVGPLREPWSTDAADDAVIGVDLVTGAIASFATFPFSQGYAADGSGPASNSPSLATNWSWPEVVGYGPGGWIFVHHQFDRSDGSRTLFWAMPDASNALTARITGEAAVRLPG